MRIPHVSTETMMNVLCFFILFHLTGAMVFGQHFEMPPVGTFQTGFSEPQKTQAHHRRLNFSWKSPGPTKSTNRDHKEKRNRNSSNRLELEKALNFRTNQPNSLSPWSSSFVSPISPKKYVTIKTTLPPSSGNDNHLFHAPAFTKMLHPPIAFFSEKLPSLLALFKTGIPTENSTSDRKPISIPSTRNYIPTESNFGFGSTALNQIVPFIPANFSLIPRKFKTPVYAALYKPIQATQIEKSGLVPRLLEITTPAQRTVLKKVADSSVTNSKLIPLNSSIPKTILKPVSGKLKLVTSSSSPIEAKTRNLNISDNLIQLVSNGVTIDNDNESFSPLVQLAPVILNSEPTTSTQKSTLPHTFPSKLRRKLKMRQLCGRSGKIHSYSTRRSSKSRSIKVTTPEVSAQRESIENEAFFSSQLNSLNTSNVTHSSKPFSTKNFDDSPFLLPGISVIATVDSHSDKNSVSSDHESETERVEVDFSHPREINKTLSSKHATIKKNLELIKTSTFPLSALGQKLYYLEKSSKVTYFTASHFCRSRHMDLLSIETREEQDLIEKFLNSSNIPGIWTSATDLAEEGNFVWLSTGESLNFSAWATNQPDNSGAIEDCVEMIRQKDGTYRWEDTICDTSLYFICEVRTCCDFCIEPEIINSNS